MPISHRLRFRVSPTVALALAAAFLVPAAALAQPSHAGFSLEVLVDGQPVPQYLARGTRYVEALKGRDYAIRLRNPLPVRVAVALSVDGLNTIDARRSTAGEARKWVLGPYETVTISGWQTGRETARRFYFTTEERSYAQWLGRAEDAGVISAVFYRERPLVRPATSPKPVPYSGTPPAAGGRAEGAPGTDGAAAPQSADAASAGRVARQDEYAATGIGDAMRHEVQQVWLDLESTPAASLAIRYEYRPQLVKLGLLPEVTPRDRLSRRERARGFDDFCPVP